ncbi:MAG: phage holin family protein [Ilumatobacter sp.]|uniref:phage holin family protein n=1 Tax=Ilumatobacter sp. TaxID=1967498 RepID=UPI002623B38A|nr:phage holin family protein [Ilumatobacter sp.]MDJ0769467.1 phage holin family protein [Ilumatobacter sp.]
MADDSPTPPARRDDASIGDVIEYVKTYARQETVGPLKGAGRWIGVGAAAAICLGIGLSLLLLGLLRLLQSEWDWSASGRWSWISYLIVLVTCVILLGITMSRINKKYLSKDNA